MPHLFDPNDFGKPEPPPGFSVVKRTFTWQPCPVCNGSRFALIIAAGKTHQRSSRCAKANESFTRQLDCRQILNHSKMSEKNDNAKPQKPQTELFDTGRNKNWLTGHPDGKPKPSEVTTTHKIGKGFK